MNEKKQKKSRWPLVLFVLAAFYILEGIESGMQDGEQTLLMVWVGICVAPFLLYWIIARVKRAKNTAAARAAAREQAAVRRPDPRTRSFTAPEAHCVVCDNTGEDHFARDQALRLAQLDEWLKNGLIDKNEYRVMKERYRQGI